MYHSFVAITKGGQKGREKFERVGSSTGTTQKESPNITDFKTAWYVS